MLRKNLDVAAILLIAVLEILFSFFSPPGPLIVAFGVSIFVATGYAWGEALSSARIHGIERALLATGLAMLVPVLGGLGMFALHLSLDRCSWTALLAATATAGATVLFIRRCVSGGPPRYQIRLNLSPRQLSLISIALLLSAGAVELATQAATHQNYGAFTELWLRPSGESHAVVGVVSHQTVPTTFRLIVHRSHARSSVFNITLGQGATWTHSIAVGRARVVADLYRLPDLAHPYRYVDNSGDSK